MSHRLALFIPWMPIGIAALLFSALACSTSAAPEQYAALGTPLATAPRPEATATPLPSETPTATPAWAATVADARMTQTAQQLQIDAANRLMVDATNAAEQRAYGYAEMTQQANAARLTELEWTATAMQTAVPMTQTQRAVDNANLSRQLAIAEGALTLTVEAPTRWALLVEMTAEAPYRKSMAAAQTTGLWVAIAFVAVLAALAGILAFEHYAQAQAMARGLLTPPAALVEPARIAGPITMNVEYAAETNYRRGLKLTLPVGITAEMLVFMARMEVTQRWGLSFGRYTTARAGWSAQKLDLMRRWFVGHDFATSNTDGRGQNVRVNEDGRKWLEKCQDIGHLPSELEFQAEEVKIPEIMSHDRDFVADNDGGGVPAAPVAP